jgi:RNA polymerase sigma-70 factor (ECF subfamily)
MAAANKAAPAVLAAAHDVDLAALARAGDRRAYGELVRRHGSAVRGLMRRIGAEPALADRVARDAFLEAFEQIAEFRGQVAFQAFVKQIAVRRFARRWRSDPHARALLAGTSEPDDEGPVPRAPDFDTALRDLPAAERICVGMCYGGGLSHAETAEALKLPPGTVKSHVARGLDRLRRRLAPPGGDGPDDGAAGRRGHG